MALYTTVAEAATRLARYAGLTVPSVTGAPASPMDTYIKEASQKMEEYLGYAWASTAGQQKKVLIHRDGQGILHGINPEYNPLTAVTAVSVPAESIYTGPTISLSVVQWNKFGNINIGFPLTYANQSYINPVPFARDQSPDSHWYKLYPDELLLTFTAGRADAVPGIFETACIELMALMIMRHEEPDALLNDRLTVRQAGLETRSAYKEDADLKILGQLSRYRL